ncbi:hypothetical protein [Microseira wollei]|uniref:hypothetical protein n=1 Tax=Microseira wollei TaxID=467598 RepID=UPI001CFD3307|nr:hypothetical protein [Microseira wollei]
MGNAGANPSYSATVRSLPLSRVAIGIEQEKCDRYQLITVNEVTKNSGTMKALSL